MMKQKLLNTLRTQWSEWRLTLFLIVFVLVPMKSSFADWNWVPSGSMNPTILEGDLVYVNKLAYDFRIPLTLKRIDRWADPEKGDVVVVFSPDDGTRLVKRVVGTAGDLVEMRNNILFINGEQLDYGPLPPERYSGLEKELEQQAVFAEERLGDREHAVMVIPRVVSERHSFQSVVVPEGKIFVMGDNRDVSQDSRYFGFADREQVIGEATGVILSFNILDWYQPRVSRFFTKLR
ncbi:signal peptidase I [Verrucomicrobiia bacterium DG1235]|nr:signal peptidase I [Verrucomicrobiae bacterium DG1235]